MMQESERLALYNKIHRHPLFKETAVDAFSILMADCQLTYYQKDEKLVYFKTPDEGLFLILDGKAEVFIESKKGLSVLLEVLQEGEMIGFSNIAQYLGEVNRPLDQHHLELEMVEDSFCLQIPPTVITTILTHETVRTYILKEMATRLANVYASLGEQVKLGDEWGESEPFVRRAQDLMSTPAITMREDAPIQDIAHTMIEHAISSVMIIDKKSRLTGLITEKDLVQRVVAQGVTHAITAGDIMTRNPYTIAPTDYYYEVLSMFYKNGVKHLPVVEQEQLVGVVTFHNLISKRDRGSMGILNTIEQSSFDNLPLVKKAVYDVLSSLINDDISTIHTLEIITKLYDRLAHHCVKLAIQFLIDNGVGAPPAPFSWYQMGSGAHGEQFMLTDQDHFLVYTDGATQQEQEKFKQYFAQLGEQIVIHLEQAGYARCEGKMMSNEEIWRGSLNEWQKRLRAWAIETTDEQILRGYNFLSFRFLYGDSSLHDRFMHVVQTHLNNAQTFLYYMAQQEQNNPVPQFNPSLFSIFRTKEKREMIDIKLHALFPLHHCLQILGVLKGIVNGTPMQLLDGLVEAEEISTTFAHEIRHAYEIALRTRIDMAWQKHLRGQNSTTKINLASIRRWERNELRAMLTTVYDLQAHLLAKL